ncbi:MAG: radical SAM protein [Myxococcales bacterium]|nr:radical SAM protein [Polyangiaceae bacterium]MDW8249996.1 radical SAM protein [Myxococcales bacterium]
MGQPGHALLQRITNAAGIPSGVHFQVADRCNHACLHCYQVQGRKGEMSFEQVKAVLDDLAASGIVLLNISGGEATLRHDLLDILRYARAKGFAVRLFTNGYTMTPEMAQELRSIGLLGVDVSLYSDDPDQHDAVTQVPGSHARTLAGIRAMVAAGLRVHLKVPTTRASLDAGPRVQRLAAELGPSVGVVTSFDITPTETGDLISREMLAPPEELVAAGLMPSWHPAEDPDPAATLQEPTCGACRDGVAILSNGDLRPCTDIVAPVGNLLNNRFLDLYRRPGPQLIRSLTWAHIHGCRDCDLRNGCERCHAHAANESGDLLGPYPSGCRAAVARYAGAVGPVSFQTPAEGCEPGRPPTLGPFRIVAPGVLQAIPDVLTEEDQERRRQFPWIQPDRAWLERMSYGERPGNTPRRRLPLLAPTSTP